MADVGHSPMTLDELSTVRDGDNLNRSREPSRDELSELLLRADEVIKQRENGEHPHTVHWKSKIFTAIC